MITYPTPKLNIGLDILRKRPDGYHDIDTLMIPYKGMHDVLEIVRSDEPRMNLYGISLDSDPLDNLCMKDWHLLAEHFALPPVAIHLWKGIPSGAGLGGGSADASATLMMVNSLFDLGLDKEALKTTGRAMRSYPDGRM